MDLDGKLGLHRDFRCEVARIGRARAPVLVIDDFLGDPQVMVDHAAETVFEVPSAVYPGLRAPIPPIYSFALRTFLGNLISEHFGVTQDEIVGGSCGYALLTTPPERLDLLQRMPHFDSTNPNQIALLHYLCRGGQGGTAFYRHRRTGHEIIDRATIAPYTDAVRQEIYALGPPPPRYVGGDDPRFERIAAFDAVFNRVLVYRSVNLHSAQLPPAFAFDADPRRGRLTANTMFIYR